jgi:hypothetical protein
MALRHVTITIPTPAVPVRCSSGLADPAGDNVAYAYLTFELSSGTKGFVGESDVSATHYAGSFTTTKTYEIQPGGVRLGDLWVTGTAGDVVQIGGVPL